MNIFFTKVAQLIREKNWKYVTIKEKGPNYFNFYPMPAEEYIEGLLQLEEEAGTLEYTEEEIRIIYKEEESEAEIEIEIKIEEEKEPQVANFFEHNEDFIFFTGETHDDINYFSYPYLPHLERIADFQNIPMDRLITEFKSVDFGMISGAQDGTYWIEKVFYTEKDEDFNEECKNYILSFLKGNNMLLDVEAVFQLPTTE